MNNDAERAMMDIVYPAKKIYNVRVSFCKKIIKEYYLS